MTQPVLIVKDLKVYYWTERGPVRAVDGVNFVLNKGETLGIAGESGCGKSTLAMSLLSLIEPPGSIENGQIILNGLDILRLEEEEMRKIRWSEISLVPQGAMNSLNPVMKNKDQIIDAIVAHENSQSKRKLTKRVEELLDLVDLSRRVCDMYPHELSGGMKQRVCIAMAIALNPKVIVADELTSALDVVVQRAVLQTLRKIQTRLKASLIFITHDMNLQAVAADRVVVMYAGKIVEIGSTHELYENPLHPYTQLLISSIPSIKVKRELKRATGLPPSLLSLPKGCVFHPRCPYAKDVCRSEVPKLHEIKSGRFVACHLYK